MQKNRRFLDPLQAFSRWLGRLACFYLASGRWGERQAAAYLRRQGLRILESNYRCHAGEIDLVARQDSTLIFVEVKAVSP